MSKLVALLSIPVGFALVRSITKNVVDEPAPKPLVPKQEGFTLGPAAASMDIAPLFPTGKITIGLPGLGGGTTIPGGARSGGPSKPVGADVVIPFFPKQTGKTFTGVKIDPSKFPKIGDISSLNFQTGLFDPAVQARLRAKQ